jgi:hypothetical protein
MRRVIVLVFFSAMTIMPTMAEKILITHEQAVSKKQNRRKAIESLIYHATLGTLYIAGAGGALFGLDEKNLHLAARVAKASSVSSIILTALHKIMSSQPYPEAAHPNAIKARPALQNNYSIDQVMLYVSGYAPFVSLGMFCFIETLIFGKRVNDDMINLVFSLTSGFPLGINLMLVSIKKLRKTSVKKTKKPNV